MIKAVIFDWGGVIAPNPMGGWLGVLAAKLDTTIQELLPYWHAAGYEALSSGEIDEATFYTQFETAYGRKLPDDVSRIWIDGSAFDPWPEMLVYIDSLRRRGYKVGLISNTVRPMSVVAHEQGLYDGFDPLILSDAVGLVKPDVAIYQRALDNLEIGADECVFIDDLAKNLEPAKSLGMITVLASDDPKQTISRIEEVISHGV